jgi:O-methyltransferase involved in polyketide biosynthesis
MQVSWYGMDRIKVAEHKEQCFAAVNSYEASDCINCSLDQKSSCQLLRKNFVPRSFLLFSCA